MTEIVFVSGGKDSTAMALALEEREPLTERRYICTPTGDELPDMVEHWDRLERMLTKPLERISNTTLNALVEKEKCIPSFRMRFCTRVLKIEPVIKLLKGLPDDTVLCAGLRADEEERVGGQWPGKKHRYPLREWGWKRSDVEHYLEVHGVVIPRRTDCARCFFQRQAEWYWLWKLWPDIFQDAVEQEERIGHTWRHPRPDSPWPTALKDLREEYAKGRTPRGVNRQLTFWEQADRASCRICNG